jgi:hypothetical protein
MNHKADAASTEREQATCQAVKSLYLIATPPVENSTAAAKSSSRGGTSDFPVASHEILNLGDPHAVDFLHLPADFHAKPVGRLFFVVVHRHFDV